MGNKNLAAMTGVCVAGSLLSLNVLYNEIDEMHSNLRDFRYQVKYTKVNPKEFMEKMDKCESEHNFYNYSSILAGLAFLGIAITSAYRLNKNILEELSTN